MEIKDGQIFLKAGESIKISAIKDPNEDGFGGSDNAGKDIYPIELGWKKDDKEGDSLYVNKVTIQNQSDWCKCELIANGHALMYTTLEDNPTNQKRVTYFKHQTTDETLNGGPNKGKKAAKVWYVTVTQEANPNIK